MPIGKLAIHIRLCLLYLGLMPRAPDLHRTTIDIDKDAFAEAREVLGTTGYKETVNRALREVTRQERLRQAAGIIRSGELGVTTPEQLAELRRPRY